jgi:hypothetical protein
MGNLLVNGELKNPSIEQLKKEFKDVDFSRPLKIRIADRYFHNAKEDGRLDIVKKAVEPVYNRIIDNANAQVRYYEMSMQRGNPPQTVYSPDVVYFGKYGEITFDFENDDNSNISLFYWLMKHPMYGVEFKLDEPVKQAQDWMEEERLATTVRNMFLIRSANYIDDKQLMVIAGNMQVPNAANVDVSQLRKILYERAMKAPKKFLDTYKSREFETTGLIQQALDLKILHYDRGELRWHYTYEEEPGNMMRLHVDTTKTIYQVRPHMQKDPIGDFARFLGDNDADGNIGIIQKMVTDRENKIRRLQDNKGGDSPTAVAKYATKIQVVLE